MKSLSGIDVVFVWREDKFLTGGASFPTILVGFRELHHFREVLYHRRPAKTASWNLV